ncbi:MAG: hypothetical protein LBB72_00835 [Spirochaetaceae bacterium]|jgi:hypothetical protein|nr:hypothetical protein [Spirochaetaceae bacterium]
MKIKSSARAVFFVFIFVPVLSLSAMDAGFLLDGNVSFNDAEEKAFFVAALPWFSIPLGAAAEMYVSGSFRAEYENETIAYVPELMRTELSFRWDNGEFKAGRIYYADPLGFVTRGYFDGARLLLDVGVGNLSAGVWYTGLLYKKSAQITMTEPEMASYNSSLDYADFWNTYFAPRRLIGALDWEHPSVMEKIDLRIALIGQYDLSGNELFYHSQYLIFKAGIPVNAFTFNLGGCAEVAELPDAYQISFAGELGIGWMLPVSFPNMLTFSGRYSSGTVDDTLTAFIPITTELQGGILKAKLSGLSVIRLDYIARLHQTFSLGFQGSYFVLNDLGTYQGRPTGKEGYFLGSELYGFLVWSPVSDLRIKGGAGVFLPSLGNAEPNGKMQWGADIGLTLALY